MVRVRKLVLAIAAASALTSGMAHALGLGEISLKSSLNQPLDAEIELLEVRDLGNGEVLPSLAAVEEFNKVGVDRPYFLTDLKFTPVLKPNGKSVIRVTSSRPVREPYLNFLVEVLWPNGRLLREYTVLLDPPLYSPQTTVAATPRLPQTATVTPRVVAPAPTRRVEPSAPVATAPATPAVAPAPLKDGQYRVGRDDTLWEIAERARPSKAVSVHQTMLAIQDLNPNAFFDGNINRLKSGQVLRLPTEQQVRTRSQADALAQVQAQNSTWREGRAVQPVAAARQLDATRRSQAGNAPAQAPAEDNLRLVSAAAGKAARGSDNGAVSDNRALVDKLAVNKESLETTQRENQELKERLGELQSQLDKLQRLIELKNDQLAKLQGGLAADAAAGTATPAQDGVNTGAAAPLQSLDGEGAEAEPQAAVEPAPAPVVVEKPAEPAPVVAAPKPAPVKPAAKPVAPAPVYEPSLIDEILADPLLLAAGGGALALLAGLGLLANNRRKAQKEAAEAELFADLGVPVVNAAVPAEVVAPVQAPAQARTPAAAVVPPPKGSDPLAEAEMYSSYGRFTQAAEVLNNAINDEPHRADLRLKLMEVYAEMGDREGFVRQEAELGEIGGSQPQIDQLRARYPQILAGAAAIGGAALAATAVGLGSSDAVPVVQADASGTPEDEFGLDELGLDSIKLDGTAQSGGATAAQDDGFDLTLDDLEAELERELAANTPSAGEDSLALDELSLDSLSGDLSGLDAVDAGQQPAGAGEAMAGVADFDFDMGMQLEPAAAAAAPQAEPSMADELAFELNEALALDDSKAAAADGDDLFAELDQLGLDDALLLDDAVAPQAVAATPVGAEDELLLELAEPLGGAADELQGLDDLERELQALGAGSEAEQNLDAAFDELLSSSAPDVPVAAAQSAPQADAAELPSLDELEVVTPELTGSEDFNFLADTDETATKLELARAYIDMGDADGARDILDEVLKEGNTTQQQEAREMMGRIA